MYTYAAPAPRRGPPDLLEVAHEGLRPQPLLL